MGTLSSGGLCDGGSNKRLLENGYSISSGGTHKYKKRKVSAVRDFPPGCGRDVQRVNLTPKDTEPKPSLSNNDNLVVTEGDCLKAFEIGKGPLLHDVAQSLGKLGLPNSTGDLAGKEVDAAGKGNGVELSNIGEPSGTDLQMPTTSEVKGPELSKELHEVEVPDKVSKGGGEKSKTGLEIGSMVDEIVPVDGAKACSLPKCQTVDAKPLEKTALKSKFPKRRVSADRDYPPFCGRNAPCPTDEERMRILLGANGCDPPDKATVRSVLLREKVRTIEESSSVRVAETIDVQELKCNIRAGNPQRRELNGNLNKPNMKSRKASKQGRPLVETVRADVEGSPVPKITRNDVEELDGDLGDGNSQKHKMEGSLPEMSTKSKRIIRKDPEDVSGVLVEAGKQAMGYSRGKNLKRKPMGNSVALEPKVDVVIVQGLMAAPNCPWRQAKGAVNASPNSILARSEVKKHAVKCITGGEKSKRVSGQKAYETDQVGGTSRKKMSTSSKKAESESKGVVKDEEDFAIKEQDESSPACQSLPEFEVSLPPYGPQSLSNGNARNKVRQMLRFFQAVCRKLLQVEEAKVKQQGQLSKRIDMEAAKIIRAKGKEVNTGKHMIGSVPGVEVGDEFQYRVELALVGIHRLYQAGIDYMKHEGMIIATSIVASGGYPDELDNPDVLIYSGQGGNVTAKDKEPQDQKLERGNLALKNSISVKNPVRVIRGFKEMKTSHSDSKAKLASTYTYDGLYKVERYWHEVGSHGKLVFKFELKRVPGQPELAWKEVKKSAKFKVRKGLCVDDISGGKELFPVCAVNPIDGEKPPNFNYVKEMKYPDWYCPTPPQGCDCIGGCSDSKKCSCVVKNGGEIPYNHNGAIVEAKPLVYECGPSCKCPPSCYNRVSQHGIKIQLEIFKTESRGWGVRSLTSIPSGSFICEYIGELLEDKEAEQRHNDEYLFDIGQNYTDCFHMDGVSSLKPDAQPNPREVIEDGGFTIDAAQFGNVGRFINHSCSPNLYAQNVLYDHEDKRMPHIMLFAAENIPPLQELTYHYNYSVDQICDSNGNIKVKSCYCGSADCTGRMY
ncbi:histone-lysine N-methyltransferase, H3 lysine-9 specific SUVH4-like [Diospyros lotus]|uniref:histone-lysine N-methyltransferase, H3 lysine-9 specific SUVH4-like n=1 Tax=Diospyros lotus TaxID=55363 RepID=UPI00224F88F4|nr:histone-lysine N-methyltransferase, H3 lysine-9 specific SUVH4-like [Diospyros lotus]